MLCILVIFQPESHETHGKMQQNTQGGRRQAPAPLGVAKGGLVVFFNVFLDSLGGMWPDCRAHPDFITPSAGHISIEDKGEFLFALIFSSHFDGSRLFGIASIFWLRGIVNRVYFEDRPATKVDTLVAQIDMDRHEKKHEPIGLDTSPPKT